MTPTAMIRLSEALCRDIIAQWSAMQGVIAFAPVRLPR
jgi:hypothetical protein